MKIGKGLRLALAAICGAAVLVSSVIGTSPSAIANPLDDAIRKLDKLEAERSAIEQKYIASKERWQEAKDQYQQLELEIADQQVQIDELAPAVVWIVTMKRQTSAGSLTIDFLLSQQPDEFLSRLSTATSISTLLDEQLALYASERERLTELSKDYDRTLATMQAEVEEQRKLLAAAKAKEAAAQQVVVRLTAQQQADLVARQLANNDDQPAAVGKASAKAQAALKWALKQKGKAYCYGGTGPNCFDCSGFAMMAYRQVGISLPRTADVQAKVGKLIKRANLLPGDLLFFYTPVHHVAIYIGNGLMIHASSPSTGIIIATISSSYVWARRVA